MTDLRPVSGAPGPAPERLRKACRDFEALFLHQLMRTGRPTGPDESPALGITRDLRDEALSREMAGRGSFGLGNLLFRQLSQAQGFSGTADNPVERRVP